MFGSLVFLYGSKEDYNRWGELVGDEGWKWDGVYKSFREVWSTNFFVGILLIRCCVVGKLRVLGCE